MPADSPDRSQSMPSQAMSDPAAQSEIPRNRASQEDWHNPACPTDRNDLPREETEETGTAFRRDLSSPRRHPALPGRFSGNLLSVRTGDGFPELGVEQDIPHCLFCPAGLLRLICGSCSLCAHRSELIIRLLISQAHSAAGKQADSCRISADHPAPARSRNRFLKAFQARNYGPVATVC